MPLDLAALGTVLVRAGRDKDGQAEPYDVALKRGEVTALLGPTGSGKSRFLSDVETIAAADSPSGRVVLLDGSAPDSETRFALSGRLVAQLTQNMHFVLDMRAFDFILAHAESREVADPKAAARRVMDAANDLAGERFGDQTPLTALSGGQSRALMIADTALLSRSPVLLIDEIENAGVDKQKALALLVQSDKIVVMATHDPVLALSAHRRLVFERGAVRKLVERDPAEGPLLAELTGYEARLALVRAALRTGRDPR